MIEDIVKKVYEASKRPCLNLLICLLISVAAMSQYINVSYGAGDYLKGLNKRSSSGIVHDISISGGARVKKSLALGLGARVIAKDFSKAAYPIFAEMGLFKSNSPMLMLRGGVFLHNWKINRTTPNKGLYVAAKLGYNIPVGKAISITPYVAFTNMELNEAPTLQTISGGITFGSK